MSKMTGVELIAQERQYQITHGIKPFMNELDMIASAIYLLTPEKIREKSDYLGMASEIRPIPRIRQLQMAGALIAAEIDRLQAIEGKEND